MQSSLFVGSGFHYHTAVRMLATAFSIDPHVASETDTCVDWFCVANRFAPQRTLILAVGHDEEVGGGQGANCMAHLLDERGVRVKMVLDEGGFIADHGASFLQRPLVLVGTAEKVEAKEALLIKDIDSK